jgi:ornithine cyclodeaminase/alanine dehydrogenase
VAPADVVVTSGPILRQPKPTIEPGWLTPGAFASAVDFDSYWSAAALAEFRPHRDRRPQQFAYYRKAGYFQRTPDPYADLRRARDRPQARAREFAASARMAINLGLALEDMRVAPEV